MRTERLPQGFGAEIGGFDVHGGNSPEDIETLRRAYDEHNLLIFRNCGVVAPERQVEIAGWFGRVGANTGSDGRAWTILRNDVAAGSALLPFHSDITFFEYPLEGISLHPLALPAAETSTTFVSNAVAWAALPAALQDEVKDLTARHYYADSGAMNFDWPVLEYWHPVCMKHRRTGSRLLFVTEHHVDRIEGMDDAQSTAVLEQLFGVLYAPERQYEHVWQLGDLVIFDNFAIQHARTRAVPPSEGARALRRVTIGDHTFVKQLALARRRQEIADV